jgi:hypothetical protein
LYGIESGNGFKWFASLLNSNAIEILTATQPISSSIPNYVLDPSYKNFDPLVAAKWYFHQQKIDEACWILFLYSYIGKHAKQHWNFLRSVYGALDSGKVWTWETVSVNREDFQNWLLTNQPELKETGGLGDGHKQYGLDYTRAIHIGNEILSYIDWITLEQGHSQLFSQAIQANEGDRTASFHYLYQSMNRHVPVNKSIQFNYLALIGKVGIAKIEPGHLYLNDILLAKQGAKRLLGGKKVDKISMPELNERMVSLAHFLDLPFSVQVLQKVLEKWAKETANPGNQQFVRRYK